MLGLDNLIRNCTKCNLHKMLPCGNKPVPGVGPKDAKIFIIGEALGADEALLGEPFMGLCGKFLTVCLRHAGIDRTKCYISNVVKCRPTDNGKKNRPPKPLEVKECVDWLYSEINEIKPLVLLTLGNYPARAVSLKKSIKISEIAGQEGNYSRDGFACKVVSTYHPSYVMNYSKGHNDVFIEHLRLARKLAYGI